MVITPAVVVPCALVGAVLGTLVFGSTGLIFGGALFGAIGGIIVELIATHRPDSLLTQLRRRARAH